jgi:hypothetical protein
LPWLLLTNATEEYDGSTWSSGGNLSTGRLLVAGAGTQTAGLAIGGNIPPGPVIVKQQQKNIMEQVGQLEEVYQLQNMLQEQLVFKQQL